MVVPLDSYPCNFPAAAILGAIDYKWTFAQSYKSPEESELATSECHKRSAKRVLKALLANGGTSCPSSLYNDGRLTRILGVFIKLGQHMAAL